MAVGEGTALTSVVRSRPLGHEQGKKRIFGWLVSHVYVSVPQLNKEQLLVLSSDRVKKNKTSSDAVAPPASPSRERFVDMPKPNNLLSINVHECGSFSYQLDCGS